MIPVIDLFAGPGGLNEGFSSVTDDDGRPVFKTVASFEMDEHACATLRLRTAMRSVRRRDGGYPDDYYRFLREEITRSELEAIPHLADAFATAEQEVRQIELGPETRDLSDSIIRDALAAHQSGPGRDWVLIGGPPCQAYSLAGRSRRTNDESFEEDKKHFLFKEYLHIIEEFEPSVFVMENVKGLLSSTHGGNRMFDMIVQDLSKPKSGLQYDIRSLVVPVPAGGLEPEDFVIRSEEYGIPQRRHRVILLGVRIERGEERPSGVISRHGVPISLSEAIGDLPKRRSGISPRSKDSWDDWASVRKRAQELAAQHIRSSLQVQGKWDQGGPFGDDYSAPQAESHFQRWVIDSKIEGVTLHQARNHMEGDLLRYGFLARMAQVYKRVPKLAELTGELVPNHKNVGRVDTPFTDRFRVQMEHLPSTTIVSHISKDGHYYVHPDPMQMRSLTVREAARLQTFPDNYFFVGGRTQQYHQVGNAVPPLLAYQIARVVAPLLTDVRLADL